MLRRRGPTFIVGFVFAIVCFVGLNWAMGLVSSSEYCGGSCHEMAPAYQSWERSMHARNPSGVQVGCIDCHLPPHEEYFSHVADKAYTGAKDVFMHYFGPEYDVEKQRKRVLEHMENERCANCHDNLLGFTGSPAARFAHQAALAEPEKEENRCVTCHEHSGHNRTGVLFTEKP